MPTRRLSFLVAAPLVVACAAVVARAADADEMATFEKIAKDHSAAIVTIKYVQKSEGQFGESDQEAEALGVMIEPDGLVMTANSRIGGTPFRRTSGRTTPTNIKILVGDDQEGIEAKLLARDSELDLAWLQIKEPGDKKFAYIDLAKSAKPHMGERVFALVQMGKFFDRATMVTDGRIAARLRKPRELFVVRGGLDTDPGLPIFTASGELVGVGVVQLPDPEEIGNMSSFRMLVGQRFSGLVLPAENIARATKRAKENPSEEESASQPAEEAKPAAADGDKPEPPPSDDAKSPNGEKLPAKP